MVCDPSNIMICMTHCTCTAVSQARLEDLSQNIGITIRECRTGEYWIRSKNYNFSNYFRYALEWISAHDQPITHLQVRMSNWGMRGQRGAPSVYSEQESNQPGNSEDLHAWSIYRQARMKSWCRDCAMIVSEPEQ